MRPTPNIVFAGAATMDMIFSVDVLPSGPGKILPKCLIEAAHGMATSAATAAARLGGHCTLLARVGDDELGARFIAEIEREGVDCRFVRRVPGVRTPLSAVIVDAAGERLIVPHYDPGLGNDTGWIPEDLIVGADAVLADIRWPQGAARVLDLAKAQGKIAVLDADTGPIDVIVDLAARATHLVFSEPAAFAVSGADSVPDAVKWLASRFTGTIAVTAGAQGCYWEDDGRVLHRYPPRVRAVDTLAAGDVFHGAFTLAIAEGQSLDQAIAFANAAAAIKCTVFGGRLGAPSRADVLNLIARTPSCEATVASTK